ncbi:2-nitropropane dioxygenase [Phlyctochytrium arcticum]|nr:2-nitropropane dioxygenase [Phlyctochytrium arcticum]
MTSRQMRPMLKTDLNAMLPALVHPVVLPPMAGVSLPALVAAAANAGCLAFLGSGYLKDASGIDTQMQEIRKLVGEEGMQRVGVGFITWWVRERLDVVEKALAWQPRCVWFSFGDCAPLIELTRRISPDTLIFVQVSTVQEARTAVEVYGVDVVVAQGFEAGGHGAKRGAGTFVLVPEIVDAVGGQVPVLAAGGVSDGRQVAASLMLGASGAVIGTRLCVTTESPLPLSAKKKLLATHDGGISTTRSTAFDTLRGTSDWPEQYDFRVLSNSVTESLDSGQRTVAEWQQDYNEGMRKGDFDVVQLGAGQGIGLVQTLWPTKKVIEHIMDEAVQLLEVGGQVVGLQRPVRPFSKL